MDFAPLLEGRLPDCVLTLDLAFGSCAIWYGRDQKAERSRDLLPLRGRNGSSRNQNCPRDFTPLWQVWTQKNLFTGGRSHTEGGLAADAFRARASSFVVSGPLASAAAQIAHGSPRLNRRYEST